MIAQNSAGTASPQVGKPWQKGQSGNPGGRPKVAADVKAEARRYTKEALDRLVYWMRSDDSQASIRAAMALLDRGCGKPTPTPAERADELPKAPIRVIIDPFKGHRELMEAREREREEQAAIPADTQALPCSDDRNGQEWP